MKNELFTLRAWFCWAIHSVMVAGVLFIGGMTWLQVSGADLIIQIPTIEKTFKK